MRRRGAAALIVVLLLIPSSGCWFGTGSTWDVRQSVTRQTGLRFEPEFGVKLGRISTAMGRFIARRADKNMPPLKGVAKVEVGVYAVKTDSIEETAGMQLDALRFPEWTPLVRIREDGEQVLVLYQEGAKLEHIRAAMVLVLDGEELVVVRLRGKLDRFLRESLPQLMRRGNGDRDVFGVTGVGDRA